MLAGARVFTLDERFQVPEEQMLQRPKGQECLKRFLEAKDLIYAPTDALDVDRFIKEVLPGTTPSPDKPEVYTAKAVYERFLSAPGLRLIPDGSIVRQTVLKAVTAGKAVVRLHDGRAFDSQGVVVGPDGMRRREQGSLNSLPLQEDVLVTMVRSASAERWTTVDKPASEGLNLQAAGALINFGQRAMRR